MCETYQKQTHEGVLQLVTTAVSNRNRNAPQFWDVWLLPGATVLDTLPYNTMTPGARAIPLGSLAEYDPNVRRCQTMRQYVENVSHARWYRQWAGFSASYLTLDKAWYAVDLYLQPPELLHNPEGRWVWHVLMDANEPERYHVARIAWHNGIRHMGPDPTGVGPRGRMAVIAQQVAPRPYAAAPSQPPYPPSTAPSVLRVLPVIRKY